ncbi:hypothetical protein BGX27_001657 [Mortierella sp. AM989]|nr:hypothetical protein BGX27_001657 [Mortierella sp. AM989]
MECEGMSPGFGLNLDNPYSSFDASYKFLSSGIPRPDSVSLDSAFKTPTSTVSMLSQQHPWSDMMFEEAYIPFHQMPQNISPSSISSDSNSNSSGSFRSRMSSTSSDHIPYPETSRTHTHEYNPVFDNLVPAKKSYNSDQDLPSLAPDSPTPEALVPSDHHKHGDNMNKTFHSDLFRQIDSEGDFENEDQEMSDQHEDSMDVDSSDSNDECEGETNSKSPFDTRESSSTSEGTHAKLRQTRASARSAAMAAKSKPSSKSTSRSKKNSGSKNIPSPRKAKSTTNNPSKSLLRPNQSRKHSSPEEESPDAKRQKFLERNRMAASKCREKKRLQTLKTIADADAITARNQALHESLDELQEEVRSLKNQILCHRDCGCDVIQKFVQSSFGTPSFVTGANHIHQSTRAHVQLC